MHIVRAPNTFGGQGRLSGGQDLEAETEQECEIAVKWQHDE